jgi:diacylglycerol kinase (ATP)
MRTMVILNPAAGSASGIESLEGVLARLGEIDVQTTCSPEHAEQCAGRAVREGYRRVVAAGGDGTINRVLNGLAGTAAGLDGLRSVELGILPLGTGNDFSYSIGMNVPIEQAIEALHAWRARPLDIVRVEARAQDGEPAIRYFLNASAAGFVQSVGQTTDPALKRTGLGALAYALTAAASLDQIRHFNAVVSVDGKELSHRAMAALIASGRTIGGGIEINPEAALDDGLIEIFIMPESSLLDMALTGIEAVAGAAGSSGILEQHRGREIQIVADPPMPLSADGEDVGTTPAVYRVIPGALRVVHG